MNQFWRQAYTKSTTHNLAKQIVYKIILMALNIEKMLICTNEGHTFVETDNTLFFNKSSFQ